MAISPILSLNEMGNPVLPAEYLEQRWYAVYTSANREKRVAEQLRQRSVRHFLPLYASVRNWRDRRVKLDLPLFPGYVFVQMALRDRLKVLQIPGVSNLVGFGGTPTALPQGEIEVLLTTLKTGVRAEPHPFLTIGRRVRVKSGPLLGLEGILVRKKSKSRFVVSLDLIVRSIALEIDEGDLVPLQPPR